MFGRRSFLGTGFAWAEVKGKYMSKKKENNRIAAFKRIEGDLGFAEANPSLEKGDSVNPCECGRASNVPESEDSHWAQVQRFLQEVGLVVDYLHWRVICKRCGEQPLPSPLFAMTADADGELTDKLVVKQLEDIARQARAGFIAGDGFPVFGPLDKTEKET